MTQECANCSSPRETYPEIVFKTFLGGQPGKVEAWPDFTSSGLLTRKPPSAKQVFDMGEAGLVQGGESSPPVKGITPVEHRSSDLSSYFSRRTGNWDFYVKFPGF